MPPPDDQFSGWFLFAAGDPLIPPDDLSGFEPVNHHELTSRFRSFDSIEDEPPETECGYGMRTRSSGFVTMPRNREAFP
jgi:hypothetical protein